MGLLLLILGVFCFLKKDSIKLLCLYVFIKLAIPYNDFIYSYLRIEWKGIDLNNFLLILLIVLIILKLIKMRFQFFVSKIDFIVLFFFITFLLYSIVGLYNGNQFLLTDIKFYSIFFIIYILFRAIITNENANKLVQTIIFSSMVYAIIVISIFIFFKDSLLYIYGDTLYSWWGNRVTFSNTTLFIITIPILLRLLFTKVKETKWKSYFLITLILSFIGLLLSQTRTLIILAIINSLIIVMVMILNGLKNKKISLKVLIGIIFGSVFLVCIMVLVNDSYFIQEVYNQIIDRFFTNASSLSVREISNYMALKDVMDNIWGYGLGKELILYESDFSKSNVGLFIDNIYFTLAIKLGIMGVSIFIIFLIAVFLRIISDAKSNIVEKFIITSFYVSFLITSSILNAQIIYSIPVLIIFLLFINLPRDLGIKTITDSINMKKSKSFHS